MTQGRQVHELASRRLGPGDQAVDELARLAAGGDEAAFDALVRPELVTLTDSPSP